MADNLREILDIARRECPEIPEAAWARMERVIRLSFGTTRPYIAAFRKRSHLEMIADLSEQQSAAEIAQTLGITSRRVSQLKKLL